MPKLLIRNIFLISGHIFQMSRIVTFFSWLSLRSDIIIASILSQQCNQKTEMSFGRTNCISWSVLDMYDFTSPSLYPIKVLKNPNYMKIIFTGTSRRKS